MYFSIDYNGQRTFLELLPQYFHAYYIIFARGNIIAHPFPSFNEVHVQLDEYLSRPIRIVFIHSVIRLIFVQNRTSPQA